MRQIVSSAEVFHLWANCAQPYASNSNRSVTLDGSQLLSYQTAIATHLELSGWVLFDRATYSPTTAQHQSDARRACGHLKKLFLEFGDRGQRLPRTSVRVAQIGQEELNNLWRGFDSAWSLDKQAKRLALIGERWEALAEFCLAASLPLPVNPVTLSAIVEAHIREQGEAMTARRSDAAYAAAATRRTTRHARWAASRAQHAVEKAKRDAERALNLPRWLAGEAISVHSLPRSGDISLRLAPSDSQRVETSWGAQVMLRDALRLFRLCLMRREGRLSAPSVPGSFAVGPYNLRAIDDEGNATVGCHSLKFAEMQRLALTLEGYDAPALSASVEVSQ